MLCSRVGAEEEPSAPAALNVGAETSSSPQGSQRGGCWEPPRRALGCSPCAEPLASTLPGPVPTGVWEAAEEGFIARADRQGQMPPGPFI